MPALNPENLETKTILTLKQPLSGTALLCTLLILFSITPVGGATLFKCSFVKCLEKNYHTFAVPETLVSSHCDQASGLK